MNLENVEDIKSRVTPQRILGDIIKNESSQSAALSSQVVNGVCSDSRRVVPGSAFFAIPGSRTNGEQYLGEAVERGAKVIISESSDLKLPLGVRNIKVNNARKAMARFSKRFYNSPDESLSLIGITGTNGKTTVSTLTGIYLKSLADLVGLIGTVQYNLGDRDIPSFKTTPESTDLYPMLKSMLVAGCTSAVMEVSSHGIHQSRVSGLRLRLPLL